MQRLRGVPEEIINPDFAGNLKVPVHWPIPRDHPDWIEPRQVPLSMQLPPPTSNIPGNQSDDEDDFGKSFDLIQNLYPHHWPRLPAQEHYYAGAPPPRQERNRWWPQLRTPM